MDYMRYDDGCGRFVLGEDYDLEIVHHYGLFDDPPKFQPNYNVSPGQITPVVVTSDKGMKVEMMKWGLVPAWWKKTEKIPFSTFNARDDKVFSSGLWRSVYKKRALVPATGYFEWTKVPKGSKEPKRKYYFHPKQTKLFSFAGFYDVWKDVEDKEWMTYTIITTEPNKEARKVHDRMPVILHQEDEASWLDPSKSEKEDLKSFLRPYEDNGLEVIEVGRDAKVNDKNLIVPLNSR